MNGGPDPSAAQVWRRALERRRAGAAPENGLEQALASLAPRDGLARMPDEAVLLGVHEQPFDDPSELPEDVVLGWTGGSGDAEAWEELGACGAARASVRLSGAPDGYDRMVLALLEAGYRPMSEWLGSTARSGGTPTRFRLLRARRDGYVVRSYREGDEEMILGLFADSFGVKRSLSHWSWKYLENPRGGPRVSLAFAPTGELVAQYSAYPVRWRGLPAHLPSDGHQVGDTMTRKNARAGGRGPSSLLARTARHFYLTHCRGRIAFNYGFNTGNINKFSRRFLGAGAVEEAPHRELSSDAALAVRRRWFARRYELRRITEVSEVDASFDGLFERVSRRYGLLVERSAEYLRWRYFDCPDERPDFVAAYRRGQLVGWIVARRLPLVVEWGDALIDPEELAALRPLLAEVRVAGQPVVGWFSDRPNWWSRELDAIGFVRRPEPQGLEMVSVPFVCADSVELLGESGYSTRGDSDLF